ncbi:MAG: cyclic nucleotide-binding domain-containing protein [bacterium]
MGDMLFVVQPDRTDILELLRRNCDREGATVVLDRRAGAPRAPGGFPRGEPDRRGHDITTELRQLGFALVSRSRVSADETGRSAETSVASVLQEVVAFLEAVPLLKGFTTRQLQMLAPRMRLQRLNPGHVLFREGDRGEEMFFVGQGTIVISKAVVGEIEEVLARMKPGDFFGEMTLFGCPRRSATARAETPVVLLRLDRAGLEHVIQLCPKAGLAFLRAMIHEFTQRLAKTDNLVAEVTRWGLEATAVA